MKLDINKIYTGKTDFNRKKTDFIQKKCSS